MPWGLSHNLNLSYIVIYYFKRSESQRAFSKTHLSFFHTCIYLLEHSLLGLKIISHCFVVEEDLKERKTLGEIYGSDLIFFFVFSVFHKIYNTKMYSFYKKKCKVKKKKKRT